MSQRSPFPGMDPYLESTWGDVHSTLVTLAKFALQPHLGNDLRARSEERVVVESEGDDGLHRRFIVPDVMVVEAYRAPSDAEREAEGGVAVVEEPLVLHVPPFEATQSYIEIIDVSSGNRVVTIIEFVSPSNKRPGDGRDKYAEKRQECIEAGVNFVEIDLSREGERELLVKPHLIPASHRTVYQACVYRAVRPNHRELYAMPLWKPLPGIKIPLRPQDDDVRLELQPLVDEIYERGRYGFDYSRPCTPPLSAEDAAELSRRLQPPVGQAD